MQKQLNDSLKKSGKNHEILKCFSDAVCCLATQGLLFCGHDESWASVNTEL